MGKEEQYSVDIEIKALEDCETDAITISSNLDNINYGLNKYKLTVNVHNAALWDIASPCMYLSVIKLFKDGECIDCCEQDFGIRSIYFDADEGFLLNGRKLNKRSVLSSEPWRNRKCNAGRDVPLQTAGIKGIRSKCIPHISLLSGTLSCSAGATGSVSSSWMRRGFFQVRLRI